MLPTESSTALPTLQDEHPVPGIDGLNTRRGRRGHMTAFCHEILNHDVPYFNLVEGSKGLKMLLQIIC